MRTTIQLDDALVERVRRFVPPRGLSRFINEVLEGKVEALEQQRLEAELREGYRAVRKDRARLNADWETIDGEGWPE